MARPEPFRSLLEMAVAHEPQVRRVAPIPAEDVQPRLSLERRLDAIALAATTPARGLRVPVLQPMVPLRLDAPVVDVGGRAPVAGAPRPEAEPAGLEFAALRVDAPALDFSFAAADADCALAVGLVVEDTDMLGNDVVERVDATAAFETQTAHRRATRLPSCDETLAAAPTALTLPRMLALFDEATRPDFRLCSTEPSQRGLASDAGASVDVAGSIRMTLAHLRGLAVEATPARPLPAVGLDRVERVAPSEKVLRIRGGACPGVAVRAFSSRDTDDGIGLTIEGDGFDDPELIVDRQGRSVAAVALSALSDEADAVDATDDTGLDELAAALGLDGGLAVLRASRSTDGPANADDEALFSDEGNAPVELVADELDIVSVEAAAFASAADDFDEHTPTPARGVMAFTTASTAPAHGLPRPAIVAPGAVRFVVEDAPARPRHDALSAGEAARNLLRARELYLVAVDDLSDGDTRGAIGHLQLAVAYDDQTALYQELLGQLTRKAQRAS